MRFDPEASDGANAGLSIIRDMLHDVQKKHPDVSTADLWTAGKYGGCMLLEPIFQVNNFENIKPELPRYSSLVDLKFLIAWAALTNQMAPIAPLLDVFPMLIRFIIILS